MCETEREIVEALIRSQGARGPGALLGGGRDDKLWRDLWCHFTAAAHTYTHCLMKCM